MKKTFKLLLAFIGACVFLLICIVVFLLFGLSSIENYQAKKYFDNNQVDFETLVKEIRAINCPKGFVTHKSINEKKFDVYVSCDIRSIVFETSSLSGGRIDYVNILNEPKVKEVSECSKSNGRYITKLTDNWHLCRRNLL